MAFCANGDMVNCKPTASKLSLACSFPSEFNQEMKLDAHVTAEDCFQHGQSWVLIDQLTRKEIANSLATH